VPAEGVTTYGDRYAHAHSEKGSWVNLQKEFLKSGHAEKVIEALQPHSEAETTEDRNAPVRRCLPYLRNRPGSSIIRKLRLAAFLSVQAT
jgi:hypothetical protein